MEIVVLRASILIRPLSRLTPATRAHEVRVTAPEATSEEVRVSIAPMFARPATATLAVLFLDVVDARPLTAEAAVRSDETVPPRALM